MKECFACHIFYKESIMHCQCCGQILAEVSLAEALAHTRQRFLRHFSEDKRIQGLDAHTKYVASSYFNNHSLFLYFDLNKNHMKYGPKFDRFFIQPINCTALINFPWLVFNVLYTNYFHYAYTDFCPRCHCKCRPKNHSKEECEYNSTYFQILRDIFNGDIIFTRSIYETHDRELRQKSLPSAFSDLSRRHKAVEISLDLLSIGLSVLFWIFVGVYVSFPMVKVLMQKMQFLDAYEWRLF
ncbi:MAG TPA: hypothetical protein PKO44_05570 [Candidatus Omnitrophota bacterium]|nr:hypothetical protein [Candidatus Omnitrophota bacterium]